MYFPFFWVVVGENFFLSVLINTSMEMGVLLESKKNVTSDWNLHSQTEAVDMIKYWG